MEIKLLVPGTRLLVITPLQADGALLMEQFEVLDSGTVYGVLHTLSGIVSSSARTIKSWERA